MAVSCFLLSFALKETMLISMYSAMTVPSIITNWSACGVAIPPWRQAWRKGLLPLFTSLGLQSLLSGQALELLTGETEKQEEGKNLFSSEFWHLLYTSLLRVEDKITNQVLWEGCSPILCFCPPTSLSLETWQETQTNFFPSLRCTFFGIAFQLFKCFSRCISSLILQLVVLV